MSRAHVAGWVIGLTLMACHPSAAKADQPDAGAAAAVGAAADAPVAARYFRKTIEIPQGATVKSASLQFTADDRSGEADPKQRPEDTHAGRAPLPAHPASTRSHRDIVGPLPRDVPDSGLTLDLPEGSRWRRG